MKYLNELASAKRQVVVEGQKLYVTEDGRIRKTLGDKEKELYRVEKTKGIQLVFEEGKQIQPKPDQPKLGKKSSSKLQDAADASND